MQNKFLDKIKDNLINKNFIEAEKNIKLMLQKDTNNYNLYNLLSIVYIEKNEINLATKILLKLIIKNPKFIDAEKNLCILFEKKLTSLDATKLYIELERKNRLSYKIIISFCINQLINKNLDKTETLLQKIFELNKSDSILYISLGINFLNNSLIASAKKCFNKSLEINPKHDSALVNLAYIYSNYELDYKKSILYLKKAILLNPKNVVAHCNLGKVCVEIGNNKEGLNSYNAALNIDNNHLRTQYNLGLYYLSIGNYRRGWDKYELRDKFIAKKRNIIDLNYRIWDGALKDSKLLIHAEQGIGDEIIISSLFNELKDVRVKIEISCDKRLINIFNRSFNGLKFFDRDNDIVNDDNYHIYSFSIAKYFRKSKDDFKKNKLSWLLSDKKKDTSIKERLKGIKKLKIGISWHSTGLKKKSIPLIDLYKILNTNFFEIINLQYGNIKEETDKLYNETKEKILIFDDIDYRENIDDIFSIINNCDLIITIDNATAQFAGALGKPTFLLLANNPMWNWGTDKISNWCPSIKIIRQSTHGNWTNVLKELKYNLDNDIISNMKL